MKNFDDFFRFAYTAFLLINKLNNPVFYKLTG